MENQQQTPINIKVTDLNVTYNKGKSNEVRALENINLEISPREYVIIFGPSGCGKSTLLYSIAGLQKPTSGMLEVDSENIGIFPKRKMVEYHRKKIGMIFQAFYLIPSLHVLDNVCLPKVFEEEDENQRLQKARGLLERFSIAEQWEKFPSELSGGQKQRVSIARALINNPDIILADEPVGNLDSKSAYNVMTILKELNEADKKTVILVTHDPAHLEYGDKIVYMKDGKIMKIEIVKNKKSPVDSYIFKDGKLKEDLTKSGLIREEFIPTDLRLLMKAFKDLSVSQIGSLIVPFKAKQLFSHIFFSMTDDRIEAAKNKLQQFLYSGNNYEELIKDLDQGVDKGGAGWDRRVVDRFTEDVRRIVTQSAKINYSEIQKTSWDVAEYIIETFALTVDEQGKKKLAEIALDRLKNRIGLDEVRRLIDLPKSKGGLGLDRRTAVRISREIEVLILIRYSA